MAEAFAAAGPRAALHRRYALLRDPHGATGRLTPRAARFAARRRGCDLDLATLAAMPAWQIDARVDRERLAAAAGLLAAQAALARAIDGAQLRLLADRFGEELIELVLSCTPPVFTLLPPTRDTLDPAGLCRSGERLMIEAADPGNEMARRICALAGELLEQCDAVRAGHRAA